MINKETKIYYNKKDFEEYLNLKTNKKLTVSASTNNCIIDFYDENMKVDLRYDAFKKILKHRDSKAEIASGNTALKNPTVAKIEEYIRDYKDPIEREYHAELVHYYNFGREYFIYEKEITKEIIINSNDETYSFNNSSEMVSFKKLNDENWDIIEGKDSKPFIDVYKLYISQNNNDTIIHYKDCIFLYKPIFKNIVKKRVYMLKRFLKNAFDLDETYYESFQNILSASMNRFVRAGLIAFISLLLIIPLLAMPSFSSLSFSGEEREVANALKSLIKNVTILVMMLFTILPPLFIFFSGLYLNKKDIFDIGDPQWIENSLNTSNVNNYVDITNKPKLVAYILNQKFFKENSNEFSVVYDDSGKVYTDKAQDPYFLDLTEAIENFDDLEKDTQDIVLENIELIKKNNNDSNGKNALNEVINVNMTTLNKLLKERENLSNA